MIRTGPLRPLLFAGGAVALGAFGYFVFTAINGPIGVPLTSPTPNAGHAASQFGAVGFTLEVRSIRRTTDHLELGLVFRNSSTEQQRADAADFSLSLPSGSSTRPIFPDGCPNWGRVDLYPPGGSSQALRDPAGTRAGATWGPSTLCFPLPANADGLTLVWEPDVAFGPLSEPIRIPLRG